MCFELSKHSGKILEIEEKTMAVDKNAKSITDKNLEESSDNTELVR